MLLYVIFGYVIASSIVKGNNNIVFIIFSIAYFFLVLKNTAFAIHIMFIVAFFGTILEEYGIVPVQFNWVTEVSIIFLLFKSVIYRIISRTSFRFSYGILIMMFISFSFLSIFVNKSSLMPAVLEMRILLRFVFLYIAIINLPLREKDALRINKSIFYFFLLQIPIILIKFQIYGQGELVVGSFSISGGELGVIIPLITTCFLIGFYNFYNKKIVYIVLLICFFGFAFASGKRAFIFFLPILIAYLWPFIKRKKRFSGLTFKRLITIFSMPVLFFLLLLLSIKLLPSFNPEGKIGGSIDFKHFAGYVIKYTTFIDNRGLTKGRMMTTMTIFKRMKDEGLTGMLIGLGPGAASKSRFYSTADFYKKRANIGYAYGETGYNWIALQHGHIGAILYFLIFIRCLIMCRNSFYKNQEPYWIAYSFGAIGFSFVMILLGLFYGKGGFQNDMVPMFYFYSIAILDLKRSKWSIPSNLYRKKMDSLTG